MLKRYRWCQNNKARKLKAGASKLASTDWTSHGVISMVTVCIILLLPFIAEPHSKSIPSSVLNAIVMAILHGLTLFSGPNQAHLLLNATCKKYLYRLTIESGLFVITALRFMLFHRTSNKAFCHVMISTLFTAHLNSNLVHRYLSTNIFDKRHKNEQNAYY